MVTLAKCTVSADTGIIHVVDAHQSKGVLLNGATAFGKTFSPSIKILEVDFTVSHVVKMVEENATEKLISYVWLKFM